MTVEYPKTTQEHFNAACEILTQYLCDPAVFINNAPYSSLMKKAIKKSAEEVRNIIALEVMDELDKKKSAVVDAAAQPSDVAHLSVSELAQRRMEQELEKEKQVMAEIEKQFNDFNEDLASRSPEFRDNYGILVRLERNIRSLEEIIRETKSESIRATTTSKLMDIQERQIDVLTKLADISKIQKIEAVTRRFFTELKKHPDLNIIADRYLSLINDLD